LNGKGEVHRRHPHGRRLEKKKENKEKRRDSEKKAGGIRHLLPDKRPGGLTVGSGGRNGKKLNHGKGSEPMARRLENKGISP